MCIRDSNDSVDIDSDNDGITDNIEAQTTADYIAPSGIAGTAALIDSNRDGLDDNFDAGVIAGGAHTGVGLTPVDTDSDGVTDYLDTDSDNDGNSDADESGHGASQALIDVSPDTDGDGLKDVVEGGNVNDGFDVNDENVDLLGEFDLADTDSDVDAGRANADPLNVDYDFREALDTDGDNVHDGQDIDDDNDGILDVVEAGLLHELTAFTPADIDATGNVLTNVSDAGTITITTDGDIGFLGFNPPVLNGGTELSTELTVTFSSPVDEFSLRVSDYDTRPDLSIIEFLRDFSITPTAVTGELNLTNDGRVVPQNPDAEGVLEFSNLGGITELTFTHERLGAGIGVFFEAVGAVYSGSVSPNSLDIDSDDDGITDNVEAQTTEGYVAPSGIGAGITDADGDGLDDQYDANTGSTAALNSAGLTPVDTDSDSVADYLDTDSDNDGTSDAIEAGHGVSQALIDASADTDGDGLKDVVAVSYTHLTLPTTPYV